MAKRTNAPLRLHEDSGARLMQLIADADPVKFGATLRGSRRALKLSQAELGEIVGVTPQAVSQWERGQTSPDFDNFQGLAKALGMSGHPIPDIAANRLVASYDPGAQEIEARRVRIVGYVGAGATAYFFPAGDLDDVPAPDGSTENTVAVEVRGDSLGALFDRWLAFYDDVRRPVTPDLIGRLCVVGLADERVLIKKIRNSKTSGRFDLYSQEDAILAVVVDWAARVKLLVPR